MRRALAIYLGCALIALYVIVRAWDHFHGRPPEPDPWAVLPQPEPRTWRLVATDPLHEPYPPIYSDNLTAADGAWVTCADGQVIWWNS